MIFLSVTNVYNLSLIYNFLNNKYFKELHHKIVFLYRVQ